LIDAEDLYDVNEKRRVKEIRDLQNLVQYRLHNLQVRIVVAHLYVRVY